jgi:hypothetical protein
MLSTLLTLTLQQGSMISSFAAIRAPQPCATLLRYTWQKQTKRDWNKSWHAAAQMQDFCWMQIWREGKQLLLQDHI